MRYRRGVDVLVRGRVGEPLQILASDSTGIEIELQDEVAADYAENRPLTVEVLQEQFSRLGGTPFYLESLQADLEGDLMVPMSRLNALRRRMSEVLLEKRRHRFDGRREFVGALQELHDIIPTKKTAAPPAESKLSVLCRTLEQVEAAVELDGVSTIYTDFEDIRLHKEARKLIPKGTKRFIPATLRVIKPGKHLLRENFWMRIPMRFSCGILPRGMF